MSVFKNKAYCDEHIKKIHYYCPYTEDVNKTEIKPKTDLKIAIICGDRIYRGLSYEADVYLITEDNWKTTLKYTNFDFFIVESCTRSVFGDWEFAQIDGSDKNSLFKEVINFARSEKIPLVYWFTQDHVYHDNYRKILHLFDHIFCADIYEIELLKKHGITAEELLPAFQPQLYNPLRDYDKDSKLSIDILFDGWSDLFRYKDKLSVLQKLKSFGLKIIDSSKEVFHNKLGEVSELQDYILGCVTPDTRRLLLKHTQTTIFFKDSLLTETTQRWNTVEAIGARVNVIYCGSLKENDIRKNLVVEAVDEESVLTICEKFSDDYMYRERMAQENWREINQKHTYNHRVASICEQLKIKFKNNTEKMASIITPTYRVGNIQSSIETYRSQSYKKKELIIIYNGSDDVPEDVLNICEAASDITLIKLPPENGVGMCLNLGHAVAKGYYCFRVDDDDVYASNYILDMMIHLNSFSSNVFGKPPGYILFEGNQHIFKRKNSIKPLTVVKSKDLLSGKVYLGGNTIGGKKSFLMQCPYPEKSFGAADSSFLTEASKIVDEVLIMDSFNMLINRRSDLTSHTWRLNFDEIKQSLVELETSVQDDIFV